MWLSKKPSIRIAFRSDPTTRVTPGVRRPADLADEDLNGDNREDQKLILVLKESSETSEHGASTASPIMF